MLPISDTEHKSNEKLFEESRNKIPTLTNEWTDFNAHDPGITLLQTFAWLFEMQGRYASYSGEEHVFKYLKLLGYTRQREQPSMGKITLKGATRSFDLPQGMKFYAGNLVFETIRNEYVLANQLVCILRDETLDDLTEMICYLDGGAEKLFTNKPYSHFYLGFREELDLSQSLSLYFTIDEGRYKRNAFNKVSFIMGEFKWEAYTTKGWEEIKEVKDETMGFLKEGYMKLKAPLKTVATTLKGQSQARHYLRCTLIKNEYDILPSVDYIGINRFQVKQQDTKVINLYLSSTGEVNQSFLLKHYLALKGKVVVMVQQSTDVWEVLENTADKKLYEIRQKGDFLKEIIFFKTPPKGKKNIRLVCYDKAFYDKRVLGTFGMMSNPYFHLDLPHVDRKTISLDCAYVKEGQIIFTHYHQKQDLNAGKEIDRIYCVNGKGKIVFGDKTHGQLPREEGVQLMITGLAETEGAAGNVKAGTINQMALEDEALLKQVTVINYEDTKDGRNEETQEEAIVHFRKSFKQEKRMITANDYEDYVLKTPGLLIHKVRAIEEEKLSDKEAEGHKIMLIVKPYGEEKMPKLSKIYQEVIESYIEKYRMLTTEIKILSPTYLGIDVDGLIYKKSGYESKALEEKIYKYIEEAVDSLKNSRQFGEPIIVGTLFGQLDSLEGIAYVEHLTLTPIGNSTKKNLSGDIMPRPDVLTYLRDYHIELR